MFVEGVLISHEAQTKKQSMRCTQQASLRAMPCFDGVEHLPPPQNE